MHKYIILNPDDNVGVALEKLDSGASLSLAGGQLRLAEDIPLGHKFSLRDIPTAANVMKYGVPIGHAIQDIPAGSWVHVHNVKTNLKGEEKYTYNPTPPKIGKADPKRQIKIQGYRRPNGGVGIRNEIWILPTVGCVNWLAERLAAEGNALRPEGVDRVAAFSHPHGCSQLGEDHENTRTILADLAQHPNAGGVLVVGLGCENNTMKEFRQLVESREPRNPNIRYMVAQDEEDEYASGLTLLKELFAEAAKAKREPVPVGELCVGLKCGGSDGLSGITANPLIGAFSDWLVDRGGRTVLTEVPEMFGAERALLNRAVNAEVFERGVAMVNNFKNYFLRYNQTIYENPSPGNKAGGITTLEDKSIGCTQKGGSRPVVDVLPYGGVVTKPGVNLLNGPGNDIVTVSAMAAAGAHLILFSTGRGTPLGGPVPVLKVSSNSALAAKKPHWIDFDAGVIAEGETMEAVLERFVGKILDIASGTLSNSEKQMAHDFAIFKDGVTL